MTHFHSARLADGRRGIWLGHAHGWFPVRLMWRMLRRGGGPRKAGGARGLPASSDFAGQDARRRRAQRAATVATGRISSPKSGRFILVGAQTCCAQYAQNAERPGAARLRPCDFPSPGNFSVRFSNAWKSWRRPRRVIFSAACRANAGPRLVRRRRCRGWRGP